MRQEIITAEETQKHEIINNSFMIVRRLCWWHAFCEWRVTERRLQIPSQYVDLHQVETVRRRVRHTLLILPQRPIRGRIAAPSDLGGDVLI